MPDTQRLVDLLRNAEQPVEPTMGDIATGLLNSQAAAVRGKDPYSAYLGTINESEQKRIDALQRGIKSEKDIYDVLSSEADRGNANAKYVMDNVMQMSGNDPKKAQALIAEMHKDPEDITIQNFMTKAVPAAAKLGYTGASYVVTKDAFGNNIAYNKFNPSQTMQVGGGGAFGAINPGVQSGAQNSTTIDGQQNPDILSQLPPQTAAQVKALAEGRMPFPSGFALRTPYWQQMLSAVSQYDPTFDAVNYNSRAKTRQDFTSGQSAKNIMAVNTAMQHLGKLYEDYSGLKNTDYPMLNTAKNYIGTNMGSKEKQTAMSNVSTDTTAVAHELAKVFRSTGMSEGEIKDWESKINTSATPAQQKAVINSAIELMNGRLESLAQSYNQGMGTSQRGLDFLAPSTKQIYAKITGNLPGDDQSEGGVVDYKDYFKQ